MRVCFFTKFQVCIVFRLVRGSQTNKHGYIGISPTGCEPHVDLNIETVSRGLANKYFIGMK